jgi:hypothetical protein
MCPKTHQHAVPIWRCSQWGLPCRRCYQQRGGLLLHRFTLTLRLRKHRREGGLFSVALSVGLPRPGVTRHRFLLESGLSSPLPEDNEAAIQPSAQGTDYRGEPHSVKSRARHALKVCSPAHPRGPLHWVCSAAEQLQAEPHR